MCGSTQMLNSLLRRAVSTQVQLTEFNLSSTQPRFLLTTENSSSKFNIAFCSAEPILKIFEPHTEQYRASFTVRKLQLLSGHVFESGHFFMSMS